MLESHVEEYTKLIKKLKKLDSDAHCTHFHGAGLHQDYYQIWRNAKPISAEFENIIDALKDGINKLKTK